MKVLIASTNRGKISIYSQIFNELGIEWCSLIDYPDLIDVDETGNTTRENAIIKATSYNKLTGMPVLANDSGLVIKKFSKNDQPGTLVRRYDGKKMSDKEMIDVFSQKLSLVGGKSKGYFDVALAIIDEKGKLFVRNFKSPRFFISKPSEVIIEGLPLRSLDYSKKYKKYLSEMDIKEANDFEGKCIKGQRSFIKRIFKKSN